MKYQANYKYQYPVRLLYGFLNTETSRFQIPIAFPAHTDWGEIIPNDIFNIESGRKIGLELGWLAIETRQTYYFRAELPIPNDVIQSSLFTLLIGLGNQGEIALWLHHDSKCFLLLYAHGVNITDKMTNEMIFKEDFISVAGKHINSIEELCEDDMNKYPKGFIFKDKVKDCIENRMKQYTYRYVVEINKTVEELAINDCLFDGTFDKTLKNELQSYHEAGKVRKLLIRWIEKNSEEVDEFSVFYWMNEVEITRIFERFYGVHPESKTDFIIRVDAENKKYELSLYRQGLKEPLILPDSAYQLIVFKNKFEYYRSENYNQPDGAWIW